MYVHPSALLRVAVWAAQACGDRTLLQKKEMPRLVARVGDMPCEHSPEGSLPMGWSLLGLRDGEQP